MHTEPTTLGRYRLVRRLAKGGMAEIWLARTTGATGASQACVVKRVLPHLADDASFRKMFLIEARIAATLSHPNIVQTFEVGEAEGVPFIAMEYLHGEDLRMTLKALSLRNKTMPIEHALTVIGGVAAGLHSAHEAKGFDGRPLGIVHRDVSPHNIFLTYDGGVKLLDFGVAKSNDRDGETKVGTLKGKVHYMAPEQCLGEPLDRRSDIYALGLVLFQVTTGRRMRKDTDNEYAALRAAIEGIVTPPSLVMPDYPTELERIVLTCLARDPDDRYPTARALQVDLEAFGRSERMAMSSLGLSSLVIDLFGARPEAWLDVPPPSDKTDAPRLPSLNLNLEAAPDEPSRHRYGVSLAPQPRSSRTDPLGALLDLDDAPPSDWVAPVREAAPIGRDAASHARLTVDVRVAGSVTVVTLAGYLTESFEGPALARTLAGKVVFDLANVRRVTSFGVREWLQMLATLSPSVDLYLARCAEPVANQLGMIRQFAGEGRVASFYAPYRCDICDARLERLIDCEYDAIAVRAARAPVTHCPRCGGTTTFDDDPQAYFAFAAAYAGLPLPTEIREALDVAPPRTRAPAADAIEKTVEGHVTRLTVAGSVDASTRWNRALDGIEGALVIDFRAPAETTDDGASGLLRALAALDNDVESIALEGCPEPIAKQLAAAPPSRVTIRSFARIGHCTACGARGVALLSPTENDTANRTGAAPGALCDLCRAPLAFPHQQRPPRSIRRPVILAIAIVLTVTTMALGAALGRRASLAPSSPASSASR